MRRERRDKSITIKVYEKNTNLNDNQRKKSSKEMSHDRENFAAWLIIDFFNILTEVNRADAIFFFFLWTRELMWNLNEAGLWNWWSIKKMPRKKREENSHDTP